MAGPHPSAQGLSEHTRTGRGDREEGFPAPPLQDSLAEQRIAEQGEGVPAQSAGLLSKEAEGHRASPGVVLDHEANPIDSRIAHAGSEVEEEPVTWMEVSTMLPPGGPRDRSPPFAQLFKSDPDAFRGDATPPDLRIVRLHLVEPGGHACSHGPEVVPALVTPENRSCGVFTRSRR